MYKDKNTNVDDMNENECKPSCDFSSFLFLFLLQIPAKK